jgi:hypothetical protein
METVLARSLTLLPDEFLAKFGRLLLLNDDVVPALWQLNLGAVINYDYTSVKSPPAKPEAYHLLAPQGGKFMRLPRRPCLSARVS